MGDSVGCMDSSVGGCVVGAVGFSVGGGCVGAFVGSSVGGCVGASVGVVAGRVGAGGSVAACVSGSVTGSGVESVCSLGVFFEATKQTMSIKRAHPP